VPHFQIPFRLSGSSFATNEQGSMEDVVACVKSVLLTEPGERELLPDFGLADTSFTQHGESLDAITQAVSTWEPRASTVAAENPVLFRNLLSDVFVPVEVGAS
jgi:phage baseplate assembly protein W